MGRGMTGWMIEAEILFGLKDLKRTYFPHFVWFKLQTSFIDHHKNPIWQIG
jgi:hypothetical protein